jgi:LmbE family N-acetylglucosaminyl deacetylase
VKIREEEFKNALKIAGINNYSCLKVEDKRLLDNFGLFKTINLEKYDYIFIPNIIDQHPDHKAVSLLLNRFLNEGANIKNNVKICFYEVWSALGLVNAYADISEVIESKKAMIKCYKAEIAVKDYEYHALGLNQYRGMFKDKKYVEAFCVLDLKEFKNIYEMY